MAKQEKTRSGGAIGSGKQGRSVIDAKARSTWCFLLDRSNALGAERGRSNYSSPFRRPRLVFHLSRRPVLPSGSDRMGDRFKCQGPWS